MIQEFHYEGKVIWSQVDANQHMRHSAYADFAAQARIELLDKLGLDLTLLNKSNLGPILLREEIIYLREVNLNDTLRVSCEFLHGKKDGSRWTIQHEIFRSDGVKAAIITVDGAWIDKIKRKMTSLDGELLKLFFKMPKSGHFIVD